MKHLHPILRPRWQTVPLLSMLATLTRHTTALSPVTIQDQEFLAPSGERFDILGVAYQPGGSSAYSATNTEDVLSNGTACLRDAALMQSVGFNTIRSYNVDPTLNHDECMSIFNAAGIYVLLDVNSPLAGQSIDRDDPAGSYTLSYLTHIFSVVEAFKAYPNVLGFFAGNEIINDIPTSADNPPYIRAVQRDLRSYIAQHSTRAIPVGYSAADVRTVLLDTFNYLTCDNSDNSSSQIFGLNSYSWCGSESSFTISTYNQLVSFFQNASIPVFLSEYGCNVPYPRVFDEVPVIFGPQMTALSGGLVYEWTEGTDNYGLVNVYDNGTLQFLQDFVTFEAQYAKLNVTAITSIVKNSTSFQAPKCSSGLISNDGFDTNFTIPAQPSGAAQLISSGVSSPPSGSIVSVTQTSVAVSVYNVDGALITGLAITSVDAANYPGSAAALNTGTSSTSTSTSSATAAAATTATSATKTGAAYRAVATHGALVGAAVALVAAGL